MSPLLRFHKSLTLTSEEEAATDDQKEEGSPTTTRPLRPSPLNEDSLLLLSDIHSSVSHASHSILRMISIVLCAECARIDMEYHFTALLSISQPNPPSSPGQQITTG
ncbi:hypothetical protein BLNAU_13126 [Blattamonas nauphoetae]|uniref:Uncharacterized protein n=1 Tax=Blattamonas nauphoetae TaxID=2049346 RepID=A0ABQ9XK94_9EUKA|nr:hypothetical protein BLNAU_13126 [Blattamonas nauphoetae]